MSILLLKTIHIVGFTAWFAGLFYLVRIFVYHTEAFDEQEPKRSILIDQFQLMESRVYKIICNPAMIITWVCGLGMIHLYGMEWFKVNTWLHIKLVLLLILSGYQGYCKVILKKLASETSSWTSYHLRLFNEVPTILLLSISILAVFKNGTDLAKAFFSIFAFGIVLVIFTKLYKRLREGKA
jgi:putative membrane protein